jgi:hypothetical protein
MNTKSKIYYSIFIFPDDIHVKITKIQHKMCKKVMINVKRASRSTIITGVSTLVLTKDVQSE